MSWRPHSRARVSPSAPSAWAVCDRCSRTYNHDRLQWQYEYAGAQLVNLRILVCQQCLDVPQEQLKPIRLPPDPVPVRDPRPDLYAPMMPYIVTDDWGAEVYDTNGVPQTVIGNTPITTQRLVGDAELTDTMALVLTDTNGAPINVPGQDVSPAAPPAGVPTIQQAIVGQVILASPTYPTLGPNDPYNATPPSLGMGVPTPPNKPWPGRSLNALLDTGTSPMRDTAGAVVFDIPD